MQKCWQKKWNIKKDSGRKREGKNKYNYTNDRPSRTDRLAFRLRRRPGIELSKIQRSAAYRAGISADERAAADGLFGHQKGKRYGN